MSKNRGHGAGFDARKRNRNIGTNKAGHGQDNSLTIPSAWADERAFHEKLKDPVVLTRMISGNLITFLVEATNKGFTHACTPDDIERVLRLLPADHLQPIKMIVQRQPTRKECLVSPVWGRLLYWSAIKRYEGPTIHLEAQPINLQHQWGKSLSPDSTLELEELIEDGHKIKTDKRAHHISSPVSAIRHTQLYRTLPHEVGHYVHFLESVERPAGSDDDKRKRLNDLYFSKPVAEKESFAHRYAAAFKKRHIASGDLPFESLFDDQKLRNDNLDPNWFAKASSKP